MPKRESPSIDWQRIYALPYNHFFQDMVKQARSHLGLPPNGITDNAQAREWLHDHLGLKKPFLAHVPTIPLWMALYPSPSEKNLYKTDVALLEIALLLTHDFGLPIRMRNYIGLYIVTNNEELLTVWTGLDVTQRITTKAGKPQLTVTVDGINAWTTKEQWLEVWNDLVRFLQELEPIPRGKRPGRGKKLQEQIRRWAEWHKLSEQPGSGPVKALCEWERQHPNDQGKYDVSTVTKAVKEFRRLITSIPS